VILQISYSVPYAQDARRATDARMARAMIECSSPQLTM
jgi:hypothetical protein